MDEAKRGRMKLTPAITQQAAFQLLSAQPDGLCTALQDLTYAVPGNRRQGGQVTLLEGVSGYLRPGELSALMG